MQQDATSPSRPRQAIVLEAGIVLVAGFAVAFLANAVSSKGLNLTRDYFPVAGTNVQQLSVTSLHSATALPGGGGLPDSGVDTATLQRLAAHGLTVCDRAEAVRWFQDPGRLADRIVFVDARDDEYYTAGHVPGAYQLFHYRAEKFLPTVLPVCLRAEKIVVYCLGGECEDSEFTARMLGDLGVSKDKLLVYAAGIHDWEKSGQPIEIGARNSGQLRRVAK